MLKREALIVASMVLLSVATVAIDTTLTVRFDDPEPVQLIITVLDNTPYTQPLEIMVHVPGYSHPWFVTFPEGTSATTIGIST